MNEQITNIPINLPTPEELERVFDEPEPIGELPFEVSMYQSPVDEIIDRVNHLPDYPVCDFITVQVGELKELRQSKKGLEELRKRLETPEGDWI